MWDVICLQECDQHSELFDHQNVFKGGKFSDTDFLSNAIYYNADKFEEISAS